MRGKKLALAGIVVVLAVAAGGVVLLRKRSPKAPVLTDDMLPIDLTWAQAEAYLKKNEYPVGHTLGDCAPSCTTHRFGPTSLRGSKQQEEELIFEFAKPEDDAPPVCVTYFPGPHGHGWEAGFDRVIGARPKAIPPLNDKSPACRPGEPEQLLCRLEATSRNGRVVPVELEVRPHFKRLVLGLRFGACAK
jgi:hypothetical protein